MKAGFRHKHRQKNSERDEANSAHDDRQVHAFVADEHAHHNADQHRNLCNLRGAQEGASRVLLADFVREPRFSRAAGERPARAPNDLREQNRRKKRKHPFDDKANTDHHITDDHRQFAAVHIGDEAGGYFADERGCFKDGTNKHKLEWIKSNDGYLVNRTNGKDEPRDCTVPAAENQVGCVSIEFLHEFKVSSFRLKGRCIEL